MIGLSSTHLNASEAAYLRAHPPRGVILFSRNTSSPQQVKALLDDVRQQTGKNTWAAIDEEGGRIWRMPFAPFNQRSTAARWASLYQQQPKEAIKHVYDDALNCAEELRKLGFTHNCAPVLDVLHSQGHEIIGNRAYGRHVDTIVTLADACMRGHHDAGIAAIGKHFPGHGLARNDSHLALPVVEEAADDVWADAEVFHRMVTLGLRHIMTAHVCYAQLDQQIASFSPFWLQYTLRQKFAFDGVIWSDDLCMQGAGSQLTQAIEHASNAGCDVLLICQSEAVQTLYQQYCDV